MRYILGHHKVANAFFFSCAAVKRNTHKLEPRLNRKGWPVSRGQNIHEASKRTLDSGEENLNGHVSCWRFQDRVGQTSCSSDAWLISGKATRDCEPASMSCSAFQCVPHALVPFEAKMHVNAIQQPFRPSFCFRAFCCHWTLSVTVGSLDFSSGGFCCFSCVASHQFLTDLGIWCRNTGSRYQCNVKPIGRAASMDRHRSKCEIRPHHRPCHITSVIFRRRSATPPHVHNQCLKCESCELPPCVLPKNCASRLTVWECHVPRAGRSVSIQPEFTSQTSARRICCAVFPCTSSRWVPRLGSSSPIQDACPN